MAFERLSSDELALFESNIAAHLKCVLLQLQHRSAALNSLVSGTTCYRTW
jgi:hypothetical protein